MTSSELDGATGATLENDWRPLGFCDRQRMKNGTGENVIAHGPSTGMLPSFTVKATGRESQSRASYDEKKSQKRPSSLCFTSAFGEMKNKQRKKWDEVSGSGKYCELSDPPEKNLSDDGSFFRMEPKRSATGREKVIGNDNKGRRRTETAKANLSLLLS